MTTIAIAVCSVIMASAGAGATGTGPDWLIFHAYPEVRKVIETIPPRVISDAVRETAPLSYSVEIVETRHDMRALSEKIRLVGETAVLVTTVIADVAPRGYMRFLNQVIAGAGVDPQTDVGTVLRLDKRCVLVELTGSARETVLVAVSGTDVTGTCVARVLDLFKPEIQH